MFEEAEDSLESKDTVSLKAESLSGDSVRGSRGVTTPSVMPMVMWPGGIPIIMPTPLPPPPMPPPPIMLPALRPLPFSEMPEEDVDVLDVEVLTSADMLLFVRECVRDEAAETEAIAGGGGGVGVATPMPATTAGGGGGGTPDAAAPAAPAPAPAPAPGRKLASP